ncbi:hypothetical protein [Pasteurella multocida]|uniref:hypothetical protein n=1 Tax=Pasteurella multocida TaxID=747 RepID=UPI0008FA79B3|nr:hypothetical protein [Pasteurella multocida]OIQ13484.1 hypothetical protein UR07_09835 [Pasteurella multocida subsp. multocida]
MKEFNLEKALAGEPVVLRVESKAFVKFEVPKELRANNFADIVGFKISGDEFIVKEWDIDGVARSSCGYEDIVGMYEEPRPTVTLTLPAPIKTAHHNQEVFKRGNSTIIRFYFDANRDKHRKMLESGSLFYSEGDAQAWFEAMKNARR